MMNDVSVPVDSDGLIVAKLLQYVPQGRKYPAEIHWDFFNPQSGSVIKDAYLLFDHRTHRKVHSRLWDKTKQLFHNNTTLATRAWSRYPEPTAGDFYD